LRELTWRVGRKLYCYARNEPRNDPDTNGEYWLFKQYINLVKTTGVIFDIGANKGEWTENAVRLLRNARNNQPLHVFEPTKATFEFLSRRFECSNEINLVNAAVTKRSGVIDVFVVTPLAGTNSLHPEPGAKLETVEAVNVDKYCRSHGINYIGFVKSDVEGFDMDVLLGAENILKEGRCDIWQFEYNIRWVNNRSFLKDVFNFIEDKPYKLGKLYGNGIDVYEQWHPELERFFECNYILVRKGCSIEKICKEVVINRSNAGTYK
jgi:FkbM family methyltransferase